MSRALMQARCPGAVALGLASIAGWRFTINPDGVGSIVPAPGLLLCGVLWRVGLRDLVAINAYEGIDTGLYLRRILPVVHEGRHRPALIYVARRQGRGRPRPGYIDLVVAAAREWALPERYIRSLRRWSPAGFSGARLKDTGELG